jgi:peptidyl-prolyl cis-trans isomerase SurA
MRNHSSTGLWQTRGLPYEEGVFVVFKYDCEGYNQRLREAMKIIGGVRVLLLSMALCALGMAVPSNLRAEITNRVVATVNSDIITLYELNRSIEGMTGLSVPALKLQDEERFYQVRRAVLNSLINQKIAEQQVQKLEIKVTQRDIDEAIERMKRENRITQEELLFSLRSKGITLEDYRQQLKREIERARLVDYEVKSKIVITEKDLRDYYQDHADQFSETHKVKLARILLKTGNPADKEEMARAKERGEDILRKLGEGSTFPDLAREYSQGPAGPEGGCLGWIVFDQLDPSLKKRIAQLSPGEYTELHQCPYGVQIVQMMEERKGGIKSFDEVRDAIYSKLYKAKVEERYADWLSKLREESFIKVVF